MSTLYQNTRIRIRRYYDNDAEGLFTCVTSSIEAMKPYLPWVHQNYSKSESEDWIHWAKQNWRTGCQYDFVIEELETKLFLGGVGLLQVDLEVKAAKLGYWLRSDHTGQGFATEAAQLAINFAKQQLGLETLIIYMSIDNKASIAIAEKLGAVLVETKENADFVNGRWLDCHFYELDLT